jgi:hypothetical protein
MGHPHLGSKISVTGMVRILSLIEKLPFTVKQKIS